MKMVKSLLLGSAAGLVAVAGAQAADLPVKARPVEYVKICSLYGAGFFYAPGTDTCIKFGMAIRVQAEWNAGAGGIVDGSVGGGAAQGQFTRLTDDLNFRNRIYFSMDTRTQTEYGTLRSYFRMGISQTTPADPVAGGIFWDRAFIQFAGFTVGHTQSFFDIYTYGGAQTYLNTRTSGDTGPAGLTVFAYTAQFGNGFSASVSLEDPNGHFRGGVVSMGGGALATPTIPGLNGNVTATAGGTTILPNAIANLANPFGIGTLGPNTGLADQPAALSGLNGGLSNGMQMPDIVGNFRIDQSWGYAGVSGAVHQLGGAYYTNGVPLTATANSGIVGSNTTLNGHPSDTLGWAVAAGGLLNVPFIAPGDKFGVNAAYSQGAPGYAQNTTTWAIFNGGTRVGLGWTPEAVYDCYAGPGATAQASCTNGTSLQLTTAWDINAAFEHHWTPQLWSVLYGGYSEIDFNQTAKNIINARTPGIAGGACQGNAATALGLAAAPAATITAFTPQVGNSCNPSYSFWQVGLSNHWNPHPDLDIGLEVLYTRLNTAYKGPATFSGSGGQPGCTAANAGSAFNCVIDDQNVWTVMARWQRNFLP